MAINCVDCLIWTPIVGWPLVFFLTFLMVPDKQSINFMLLESGWGVLLLLVIFYLRNLTRLPCVSVRANVWIVRVASGFLSLVVVAGLVLEIFTTVVFLIPWPAGILKFVVLVRMVIWPTRGMLIYLIRTETDTAIDFLLETGDGRRDARGPLLPRRPRPDHPLRTLYEVAKDIPPERRVNLIRMNLSLSPTAPLLEVERDLIQTHFTRQVLADDVPDSCPICHDDFLAGQQVSAIRTPDNRCGHCFHFECLTRAIAGRVRCPYCREAYRHALVMAVPYVPARPDQPHLVPT